MVCSASLSISHSLSVCSTRRCPQRWVVSGQLTEMDISGNVLFCGASRKWDGKEEANKPGLAYRHADLNPTLHIFFRSLPTDLGI